MRILLPVILALTASLAAQDILYYKFNAACGAEVINYAIPGPTGAKIVSTMANAPASSWTSGVWGGGFLASDRSGSTGTNHLVTGWAANVSGSFSVACWIRNRPGNPQTLSFGYLWGSDGGNFRCFTGSSGKLFMAGWPNTLTTQADVTALVNAGYVHIAAVIDATAKTGTWYINGVAEPSIKLTSTPSFTSGDFAIGSRNSLGSSTTSMDIDEFLLTRRVLTVTEIQQLMQSPLAAHGVFGTGNGPTLLPSGPRPSVGEANHGLEIVAPNSVLFVLVAGSGRCTLGGTTPLPYDLGAVFKPFAGTMAWVDTDLATLSQPLTNGKATVPLPIPNNTNLLGMTTYWQAYTVTAKTNLLGSAGLALSIGH